MILELNRAFGGELWNDNKLCYCERKQLKPATVTVGPPAPANWYFRTLPYYMDHTPPTQHYYQCENDLAKLFLTVLIAESLVYLS
jgi:hypothetical protein